MSVHDTLKPFALGFGRAPPLFRGKYPPMSFPRRKGLNVSNDYFAFDLKRLEVNDQRTMTTQASSLVTFTLPMTLLERPGVGQRAVRLLRLLGSG